MRYTGCGVGKFADDIKALRYAGGRLLGRSNRVTREGESMTIDERTNAFMAKKLQKFPELRGDVDGAMYAAFHEQR